MKKRFLKILFILSALLSVSALVVSTTFAASGAIWTTNSACGAEGQDANHYNTGETVYINGDGFDAGTYSWSITGQPGGASSAPGAQVAGGSITVDSSGAFCFAAYTIGAGDWGEFKVNVSNKGDNYSANSKPVNPTETSIPTDIPTTMPTDAPTETPTSTPTETPTSTPTETPTSTPTETPTSTPTETATSTVTPETPNPQPTNPPTATSTSTATTIPTVAPTNTVAPTATTAPSATVGPTSVPQKAPVTGGYSSPNFLQAAAVIFALISIGAFISLKKVD